VGACITLTGVKVTYPHTFLASGILGFSTINLAATAKMRYEGATVCP
jgi:hypothetical protein